MYLINEIFTSVNGEGLRAGQMADFIRLAGCPLRCAYCDTTYAQQTESGSAMSLEEIVSRINSSSAELITLTGGEPLFTEGVEKLIEALLDQTHKRIEIETSGAVSLELIKALRANERLSVTLDYKLPSSQMCDRMVLENYKELKTWDVVKYVVMTQEDLTAVREHFLSYILAYEATMAPRAILSPVYGKMEASELVSWLLNEAKTAPIFSQVGVQLQLHKYIWNPNERGV